MVRKIIFYFGGLMNGTLDIWGREISVWGPIVDEKIGIDYRKQIWEQDKGVRNGKT